MAILQVDFLSKTLKRHVTFNAIVPVDTADIPGQEKTYEGPIKSLYLLHGISGNQTAWISGSRIDRFAQMSNIAVFMPAGENSFYLDDENRGELYGEYIGHELVEFTRKMFPVSERREDTFIGGLSMGGYGAIRNGLKYADNFSRIIALSSALITKNIAGAPVDFKDDIGDYKYYKSIFGDLNQLLGSDKDPEALINMLKKKKAAIPKMYMACGTQDFLLNENRDFHNFLVSENIDHTYVESPGIHDWVFWNEHIEKAIEWLLN